MVITMKRSIPLVLQVIVFLVLFSSMGTCYESHVKEPPIAQRKRDFKMVLVGEDVKLLCPINGNPKPQITWSIGSEQITDYAWERFSLDKKFLIIKQVQYDDMGIYICKGINGYGTSDSKIELFVMDKEDFSQNKHLQGIAPKLTEDTKRLNEAYFPQYGSSLYLPCSALGQPEPDVYWLKNGIKIDHHNMNTNDVLQLNNLNVKDSAVYTCYAQNSKGFITKNFTVNVQTDHVGAASSSIIDNNPSLLSGEQSYTNSNNNYKGPDYSIIKDKLVPNDPKNTTVEEGGSASFECKAMVGKSTWLKKLRPGEIQNDDDIRLQHDSFRVIRPSDKRQLQSIQKQDFHVTKLILQDVSWADAGMYICWNGNHQESTFKYAILHVKEGSGVNDKGSSTDPLVLVVACLGAFVLVFLILIIVCICKRNNGKPSPSANQSVETPEIHEKMLGDHQTVQQSTGSPGSGGSGRHHQQHPNSHYTGNVHHNHHHHPSSNMEAFSNTNTQYHPKDYYTQKWINNPKMGLPLPPTPMEDTNNHNRNLHQQQHGSRYINNHDSTDLMMTTNAKPRGSYHR